MDGLIFIFIFALSYLAITIMVIVNIINNEDIDNNNKIFWIVLILAFNFIGIIVYLLVHEKNVLK